MSKKEKLKEKFEKQPKDFTYEELVFLLTVLGFEETKTGHSAGAAVCFVHKRTGCPIRFHRPHQGNIIKGYLMKQIKLTLKKEGLL